MRHALTLLMLLLCGTASAQQLDDVEILATDFYPPDTAVYMRDSLGRQLYQYNYSIHMCNVESQPQMYAELRCVDGVIKRRMPMQYGEATIILNESEVHTAGLQLVVYVGISEYKRISLSATDFYPKTEDDRFHVGYLDFEHVRSIPCRKPPTPTTPLSEIYIKPRYTGWSSQP